MKNLLFATMMFAGFSTSLFANENKGSDLGIQIKKRELTAEIQNCSQRGGNCLVVMTVNGVTRTYKVCCDDVIVIVQPSD